ncbi:hypothetical protein NPIL_408801 [Nephila pilipes]|uniref:Uncharacterized protein n=1 Tax=Nephila pilipes TaxID=299642 RepID=A0A8X6TAF8_NEPPI|nr:hypothetical protein NPIL_408801 [Nephila pilipes]
MHEGKKPKCNRTYWGRDFFYLTSSVTIENVQSSFSATSLAQNKLMSTVLLSTAVFFIRDKYGNLQSVRGLLDAATIQAPSCDKHWSHVSSVDNLADLISRGVNPSKMLESVLSWEGPAFLTNSEYHQREIPDNVIKDNAQCELKKSEL